MRSGRSLGSSIVLMAAAAAFAGCGSSSEHASPVPPPLHDGGAPDAGPGATDGGRDDGATPATAEVPFEAAFPLFGEGTCTSQGHSDYHVTLPRGHYQFADCTYGLTASEMVSGMIVVTAEPTDDGIAGGVLGGSDGTWTTTLASSDAAPRELTLKLYQPRFADWSEAPLHLRFDFTGSDGQPHFAQKTLTASDVSQIVTFRAPTLEGRHVQVQTAGGVTQKVVWPPRKDAAGLTVLRVDETVSFEIPFELAPGVTSSGVGGSLRVRPDTPQPSDACVFGDFVGRYASSTFQTQYREGWDDGNGGVALHLSSIGGHYSDCAANPPLPSDTPQTGTLSFDPGIGPVRIVGRYGYRRVDDALPSELVSAVGHDANGDVTVTATNIAPYGIYGLTLSFNAKCSGGMETPYVITSEHPAPVDANGVLVHETILPGASVTFTAHDLREALKAKDQSAFDACASGTFTTTGAWLHEARWQGIGTPAAAPALSFTK